MMLLGCFAVVTSDRADDLQHGADDGWKPSGATRGASILTVLHRDLAETPRFLPETPWMPCQTYSSPPGSGSGPSSRRREVFASSARPQRPTDIDELLEHGAG